MNRQERATQNVKDILSVCVKHDSSQEKALVISDSGFGLTDIIKKAYEEALPHAQFVDFKTLTKDEALALFETLSPKDLVVLIQTDNFRLDDFRIRLHLFEKKLKVIEHMHLIRNPEEEWDTYIDSLAYDTSWYPIVGPYIKEKLDVCKTLRFVSQGKELIIAAPLEEAKLNIGDYAGMENIGGTFPIGEVFTEARDLATFQGEVYIYAFADKDFKIRMYEPFLVTVKDGLIVSYAENTPDFFKEVLEVVKGYERPILRELGFGLNRAITRDAPLTDITAFERIAGIHFSLGEKHSVYKKEGITTNKTKFHIDIFPDIDEVWADETLLFRKDGGYVLPEGVRG